jgi:long-subunit fatty acid transport protein
MKKIILSFFAMITFSFSNAQMKDNGAVEITPKIGSSSFTEYSNNDTGQYNNGIEFGATVDYYFNSRWSLRTGLMADKMGSKNYDAGDLYEDKLNYLSVPINANWHFGSTRKWNLNFGLSPSFLTSAKFVENGTSSTIPSEAIKSFQLGFSYGIGYKIGINEKFGILLDAQWFNGLTNISNVSNLNIKNGGFSFNVGGVIQL